MSEDKGQDNVTINGWASHWTLAAPPDQLFRATVNHLELSLTETPYRIQVCVGQLSIMLTIPAGVKTSTQICAHGFRVTREADNHADMLSCFKPEAGVVLFESDASLSPVIQPADLEAAKKSGSAVVWSEGKHHLVLWKEDQEPSTRLILLAGTGQPDQLIARARAMTTTGAHQPLDARFREMVADGKDQRHLDFLLSRLRPASPDIPYPWFAGADGEPVWDLATLYLLNLAIIDHAPGIAAGMINNLVELMDQQGNVPVSGGCRHVLILGPPAAPLLLRMFTRYQQIMTSWPVALEQTIRKLDRYLCSSLQQIADFPAEDAASYLQTWLTRSEATCWEQMQQYITGTREAAKGIRAIIKSTNFSTGRDRISTEWAPWFALLDSHTAAGANGDRILTELLTSQSAEPQANPSESGPVKRLLTVLIAEELKHADQERTDEWIAHLNQTTALQLTSTDLPINIDEWMGIVSLSIWSNGQQPTGDVGAPSAHHRAIIWLNRKRKWIAASVAAFILIGIIWLFGVMTRESMPASVYETNMGIVLQHYQGGRFDDAMEKLLEMERRGAKTHAGLQFVKGKLFFKMKDYDQAVECFEYAAKNRPGNPAPEFNIALCYFHKKDYQRAAQLFETSSRQYARTQPAYALKAEKAGNIAKEFAEMRQVSGK